MSRWCLSRGYICVKQQRFLPPFSVSKGCAGRRAAHCGSSSTRVVVRASRLSPKMQADEHQRALAGFLSTKPRIILGSGSFSRKAIFEELGIEFEVVKPDIDEKAIRRERPEDLVLALAHAKAAALRDRLGPSDQPVYLVTADQVVVYEDTIREKPTSAAEAREFISGYGKAPATTVGGIVVSNLATGKTCEALDIASVQFRPIPEPTVEKLIEEGTVFLCAGGLMVEHELVWPLVTKLDGTMDSIMGMGKHVIVPLLLEATIKDA